MTPLSVETLVAQIKAVQPANESERQMLYQAGRELANRSESAFEAANRVVYSPQLLFVTKVAVDLGILRALSKSQLALTVEQLAQDSAAKPEAVLVKRILRFLASHSLVEQVDGSSFKANTQTHGLALPAYEGGITHSAECLMPCVEALPKFLANNEYRNPQDSANSAFQVAMKTDLPAWAWSMGQPELTAHFFKWMAVQTQPGETWIDVVDVPALLKGSADDTVLLVDVGGSIGSQSVAFKQRLPDIPGRVILQDLEGPIGAAIPCEGVEKSVVDFWQPQQIKNARIYYMRSILHDFPDAKVVELLKITIAAAGPDSVIAIDEMVLPDVGANWRATAMDINMMCSLAALERTESEWHALLDKAGLKVRGLKKYQQDTAWSVIIAVRK